MSETYPRRKTHPAIMGSDIREKKPGIVIDGGRLKEYVGIGWIDIGEAKQSDYEKYPELSDDKEQ